MAGPSPSMRGPRLQIIVLVVKLCHEATTSANALGKDNPHETVFLRIVDSCFKRGVTLAGTSP